METRTFFLAAPAVVALLALSACGTADPGQSDGSVGTAPSARAPQTSLTVNYTPDAGKPAQVWKLTCDPTGGSHPQATAACALLATDATAGKDPFAATKPGLMCTMIYGGPQTATVTGTWRGKPVNASFTLKNGCEIGRWQSATPLLGATPTTAH